MKLKAISFNIRCIDDEGGYDIEDRAPRMVTVTEKYDADIMGLQEYSRHWEGEIGKLIGDKYEFFNKYRDDDAPEGTPILWKKDKFDCLKKGYFWFSETPEVMSGGWDSLGYNRICVYAVLQEKQTGKTFVFMNTHFGFGPENQVKSVRLMQEYIEKMSQYPVVVTGDFNMRPNSPAYAEMVKKMQDVNELTVQDRRTTFHGYHPEEVTDAHIDYCFINERVKPLSFKIIDETVDGKYPSDHYGLYIELEA